MTEIIGQASSADLFDLFHGQTRRANERVGGTLEPDVLLYLVNLLVGRARIEDPKAGERTLVELHAEAAMAAPSDQVRTYQELGDHSLYRVGYFKGSLDRPRRAISQDYYCAMGAAAYHQVDLAAERWFQGAFGSLFRLLAGQFRTCVKVLHEVRRQEEEQPDRWFQLLEEWNATGDPEVGRQLRAYGLILPPRNGDV